jgi:hypothetical protein
MPDVGVFLGLYNAPASFVSERLLIDGEAYDAAHGYPLDWMPNRDRTVYKAMDCLNVTWRWIGQTGRGSTADSSNA